MASSVASGNTFTKGKIIDKMKMSNLKSMLHGELKKSIREIIRDKND